jgi:4,5-DOPA dioxygenase extradiol
MGAWFGKVTHRFSLMTLPALFISHGSPMLALEQGSTTHFLQALSAGFSRPRAIVVASAHWETAEPRVTGAAKPETIHDFHGFPQALYALRYPARGEPALAARVVQMLQAAGIAAGIDEARGLDHGAWNPLLLMYPAADIPVIALSIQPKRDARWHYTLGKVLGALRAEDILVIGTGNLTHNLYQAMRGHHDSTPAWVTEFAEWVAQRVAANDIEALLAWQERAPFAIENHPTPEHFLPFFIALGAGGTAHHAQRLHRDISLGVLAMDAYMFGETADTLEQLCEAMQQEAVYHAYATALKAADAAGPKEIPKADGLLHHAEAMLREAMAQRGVSVKDSAAVMQMLKTLARAVAKPES